MKAFVTLSVLAIASITTAADMLTPDQPYRASRSNAVTYDVDFSVVVTPPYKTQVLKVWLPIPQSDFGQEVSEGQLSSFPIKVEPQIASEPLYGNRFAYFEFSKPEGAQVIRHQFQVKVWELRWNLDPQKVESPSLWPSAFDRYRKSEEQSVVVDDRITTLVRQIVPKPVNPLRDLSTVMSWVNTNFEYDHIDASLRASSIHGLEKRRGHCSDYHGFCASMGRALGYPRASLTGSTRFRKTPRRTVNWRHSCRRMAG